MLYICSIYLLIQPNDSLHENRLSIVFSKQIKEPLVDLRDAYGLNELIKSYKFLRKYQLPTLI